MHFIFPFVIMAFENVNYESCVIKDYKNEGVCACVCIGWGVVKLNTNMYQNHIVNFTTFLTGNREPVRSNLFLPTQK